MKPACYSTLTLQVIAISLQVFSNKENNVSGATELDHSDRRLYQDIPVSILMLFHLCSFVRLPKAEGEDCTLGGSKERHVGRRVPARRHPPPTGLWPPFCLSFTMTAV